MNRAGPYAAMLAVFAEIKAALALTQPEARGEAMRAIPRYRSRGKGRGTPSRNYMRPYPHNTPHQGAQERMRRRIGGWAAPRGNPGFTKQAALDAIVSGRLVTYNDLREFKYGN